MPKAYRLCALSDNDAHLLRYMHGVSDPELYRRVVYRGRDDVPGGFVDSDAAISESDSSGRGVTGFALVRYGSAALANAYVMDTARVEHNSRVGGEGVVSGKAYVSRGHVEAAAVVGECAVLSGSVARGTAVLRGTFFAARDTTVAAGIHICGRLIDAGVIRSTSDYLYVSGALAAAVWSRGLTFYRGHPANVRSQGAPGFVVDEIDVKRPTGLAHWNMVTPVRLPAWFDMIGAAIATMPPRTRAEEIDYRRDALATLHTLAAPFMSRRTISIPAAPGVTQCSGRRLTLPGQGAQHDAE